MATDLEIKMKNIELIAESVVKSQNEYKENPMHNEYMNLAWNLGVLKDAITELQDELKIK